MWRPAGSKKPPVCPASFTVPRRCAKRGRTSATPWAFSSNGATRRASRLKTTDRRRTARRGATTPSCCRWMTRRIGRSLNPVPHWRRCSRTSPGTSTVPSSSPRILRTRCVGYAERRATIPRADARARNALLSSEWPLSIERWPICFGGTASSIR